MPKIIFIFIITFFVGAHSSWSSTGGSRFFNVSAGLKKLSFEKKAGFTWSNFCFDKKMGCARFQISNKSNEKTVAPSFGFIKVVTDKLEKKDFEKYCRDVFDISYSSDIKLKGFISEAKISLPHCSWSSPKDETHFFWREGITIVLTTTHHFDVEKIIREARFNDVH